MTQLTRALFDSPEERVMFFQALSVVSDAAGFAAKAGLEVFFDSIEDTASLEKAVATGVETFGVELVWRLEQLSKE